MRISIVALCLGAALAACGGSPKKADDASKSSENEPAPKWDTSSESADNASHPHFSSRSGSSSDDSSNKPSAAQNAPSSPVQRARRSDEYDKEATEMVLNRAARQVKANCGSAKDEDGKAVGPWGKTTVTITLGHNGHTKGATLAPEYEGKPSGRCILQAFSNLTYPPWSGADTSVDWSLEVSPPGK